LIGLPIQIALGTLRLAAVMLELASSIRFHHAKKVSLKLALLLGMIGAVGSVAGVTVMIQINPKILNIIISILMVFVALLVLNKNKLGIKEREINKRHILLMCLTMVAMGFYTGFFGAGSGVFNSLLFVFFGFSFLESAAMGRVVGLFTSLAGALIFAQHGLINYPLALALGFGFALGSWLGIGVALRKTENYIKGLILFVVIFSIIKLILNSLNINVI
jgi:uncharacterized protein